MAFDFNEQPPKDDKGLGKIRLGDETAKAEAAVEATGNRKTLMIGGAAVAGAAIVIAGIFALASGDDEPKQDPAPTVPQTQPQIQPAPSARPKAGVSSAAIIAQSIAEKNSAIYRNDQNVHRGQDGAITEAYIGDGGVQTGMGEDFNVHIGLFKKGGISVLIASGPHAGTRLGFFPVSPGGNGSTLSYEKIGTESVGADGRTTQFSILPYEQRTQQVLAMRTPRIAGSGVTVDNRGRQFEHKVMSDGKPFPAFTMFGSPEEGGAFSVKIWNGDTYKIDLNTMEYSISSAFLTDSEYAANTKKTGTKVTRTSVQGVIPTMVPKIGQPSLRKP